MKKILILPILIFLITPLKISAQEILNNYVVMDIDSKRVLNGQNIDEQIYPASTTKIMTAIVAIENSNPLDVVKVGNEILIADGTNIYIEPGENMLLNDLLYGMILRSGNDAALALANHTGGNVENFVKLMNEKARQLNLKNTNFENPTGLDDTTKNTSSVHDLATIYSYAYNNKNFRDIVKTKTYKTSSDKKSYYFKNRTEILDRYNKATGGKTGYTPKAGRLLVSSASNNDLNLVIASRGNTYGYNNHISMYENMFSKYKNYLILDKNSFNYKSNLDGKLYIKNSFIYPLTKEEKDKISKKIMFNNKTKNEVGEILIYLDKDLIHKEKVYLREAHESFFQKLKKLFK